jgi:SH3-like domain-containing protein
MVYRCNLRVWGTLALVMGAIACQPNPADPVGSNAPVGGENPPSGLAPQSAPGDSAAPPSNPGDRPHPNGASMGPGGLNATQKPGDRPLNSGAMAQSKHGQAGIGDLSPVKGSRPAPTAPAAAAIRPCQGAAYVRTQGGEGVRLREGPHGDFAAIARLSPTSADVVELSGSFNNWMQVRPSPPEDSPHSAAWQEGWVYGPRLGVRLQGETQGDRVSLYPRPALEGEPRASLPADTEASLLSCTADWFKVQTPDGTGWVPVDHTCPQPTGACPL